MAVLTGSHCPSLSSAPISSNVAQLLLKAGASPYILDKDGNTLLHLVSRGSRRCAYCLLGLARKFISNNPSAHQATKNLDVRSMRLLLKEDSLALFTENNVRTRCDVGSLCCSCLQLGLSVVHLNMMILS